MSDKKEKKSAKKVDVETHEKTETEQEIEKFKEVNPDIVLVKEDDLRELVTETVTKLMAEDVLDMDDEGRIGLKEDVELKKKVTKRKSEKSE